MTITMHILLMAGAIFAVTFFLCGALIIPAIEWSRARRE